MNSSWPKMRCIRGFTLLELLIVVLIVGVLAAVALPQYKLAVAKSRFSALKPVAKSIYDAQEVFYLANNRYTSNLADLDVSAEDSEKIKVNLGESAEYEFVRASLEDEKNRYTMYQKYSENFAENIYCEALKTDEDAKNLCKSMGGVEKGEDGRYIWYLLVGEHVGMIPGAPRSVTGKSFRCLLGEQRNQGTYHQGICLGYFTYDNGDHAEVYREGSMLYSQELLANGEYVVSNFFSDGTFRAGTKHEALPAGPSTKLSHLAYSEGGWVYIDYRAGGTTYPAGIKWANGKVYRLTGINDGAVELPAGEAANYPLPDIEKLYNLDTLCDRYEVEGC